MCSGKCMTVSTPSVKNSQKMTCEVDGKYKTHWWVSITWSRISATSRDQVFQQFLCCSPQQATKRNCHMMTIILCIHPEELAAVRNPRNQKLVYKRKQKVGLSKTSHSTQCSRPKNKRSLTKWAGQAWDSFSNMWGKIQ